ncbi:hypothetical protein U5640_00775 [Streptomyces sp. SS7]|uniref:hypothetical protein n=1 Tax=Streptomyces sp. SS7 TaxID=3108485 RepID=UPI0030EE75E5
MGSDFLLREQFVTDPAQILAEYVRGERLEPRRAEDTNRLVHSVMSNPGLVRWIRDVARGPAMNGRTRTRSSSTSAAPWSTTARRTS